MPRNNNEKQYPVFVYGTLMPEGTLHSAIEGAVYQARAAKLAGYQMYDTGWFPTIVKDETAPNPVQGWVLDFIEAEWPQVIRYLDHLEGEGYLYTRELVEVMVEGIEGIEEPKQAWVYTLPPTSNRLRFNATRILTNRWIEKPRGIK
jgi:gamma-glutamylcyclotransferase (GGCT)/AIG2-like uncharacterized protein YtfP